MTAFEAGEPWAAQFVRDTLDGKPAQSVTVTGDEDTPMLVQAIRMIVVRPDHSDRITELITQPAEINLLPERESRQAPHTRPGRSFSAMGEGVI